MSTMLSYIALALAIVLEVAATTFLCKSEHFTKLVPTAICAVLYASSFYVLAQVLRTLPLGIAYASWGGLGLVLTVGIGMVVFKQKPDAIALVGIALIVVGVVLINGFSKMSTH